MARYVATIEFQNGKYFTSFPGIDKAYSVARRSDDIIPHAREFLNDHAMIDGGVPPSLDDALTDPDAPFEGVRLVIFEWEPPTGTKSR
jgi:hypothetical protein